MDLYDLTEIDFDTLNETDYQKLKEYRKTMHEHVSPEDPLEPFDVFKRNIRIQLENPDMVVNVFSVNSTSEDKMIGLLLYGYFSKTASMYEKNPHLAFAELSIIPEYRRKGIARSLMRKIYEDLKGKDKKFIISNTVEEAGLKFIESLGGKPALDNIENRLELNKVDWDMIDEWVQEGMERNPDTQIEFFETVPEHLLEQFASVLTETLDDVPRGELQIEPITTAEDIRRDEERFAKMERFRKYAITIEPDGEISGLTWVGINPHVKERIGQGLTAVRKHHRGRGLGKWVKAALLNKIRKELPMAEFIATHNATSNAAMLHINEKLGFKEHKRFYNLQVTWDEFEKYVLKGETVVKHT